MALDFCMAPLNHSSGQDATIVLSRLTSSATMVSYKERLAAALAHAQVTDTRLAKELGVSIQAVRKVAAGTTTAFTAENNSKAARFLGVSPDWLATGEGEMFSTLGWPGKQLTLKQINQWPPELVKSVEDFALFHLSGAKTQPQSDMGQSNNGLTVGAGGTLTGQLSLETKQGRTGGKRNTATAKRAEK